MTKIDENVVRTYTASSNYVTLCAKVWKSCEQINIRNKRVIYTQHESNETAL